MHDQSKELLMLKRFKILIGEFPPDDKRVAWPFALIDNDRSLIIDLIKDFAMVI